MRSRYRNIQYHQVATLNYDSLGFGREIIRQVLAIYDE